MKKLFLLSFLLIGISSAFAQRHLKGSKGIELDGGITALGWYVEPDFTYFFTPKSSLKVGLQYENAKFQSINFSAYSLNGAYNYTLFDIKNKVFFDATGGLNFNLSHLNNLESSSSFKTQYFNVGAYAGTEVETYFSDKIAWTVNFRQCFYFKENLGSKVYYLGTGIKYLF